MASRGPRGLLARAFGRLLASGLAFGLATAAAQTASSAPARVDRGASAIPVTEILKRAEEDQERAQNARRLLSGAEPTARLRIALDSIAEPVEVEARVTGAPSAPKPFRLRRPISCWALLSMLAVLLLEQNAPLLVREFALLIAVVPVIRLLPAGLRRGHGFWPYVAIGLYALDQLGAAVIVESRAYRMFLLAETALALVLTGWMLRQLRQSATLAPAARRIGQVLATASLVLFGISVVANVAGNVSLGEALDRGVIDSGYFALLLYAGVSALRYISRALLGLPELAELGLVQRRGEVLHDASVRGLVLCAAIAWLLYTLDRFRLRKPLEDFSRTVFGLGLEVGEVSIHLGDVLIFALCVWLAFVVSRVVRNLLRDELGGHASLPRGVGNSIASLTYYAMLMIGFLVALSAAGFKVGQLTLVFSALGVGIGFGLQNVVNSFVSGLVLMFERPIQPGDIVDVAGTSGTVREIGLRATTIRTFT